MWSFYRVMVLCNWKQSKWCGQDFPHALQRMQAGKWLERIMYHCFTSINCYAALFRILSMKVFGIFSRRARCPFKHFCTLCNIDRRVIALHPSFVNLRMPQKFRLSHWSARQSELRSFLLRFTKGTICSIRNNAKLHMTFARVTLQHFSCLT